MQRKSIGRTKERQTYMSLEIGQVINNCKVAGRYSRGWDVEKTDNTVWAIDHPEISDVRLILFSEYLDSTTILEKDSMIQNLVLIKRDKNLIYVALKNYIEDLAEYYYSFSNGLSPLKNSWNNCYMKWRSECSGNQFTSIGFSLRETSFNKKEYKIYELDGKKYRLPLLAPVVVELLQGDPLFYPHVFYINRENKEKTGYAVYKTDNDSLTFPMFYKGKVKGRSISITREVLIYLHGFVEPFKWHFGIWNHKYKKNKKLFPKCVFEEYICDVSACLKAKLFKEVHLKIKNDCHKYLLDIVTFFESNTTKKMLKASDKGMYTHIEINCNGNTISEKNWLVLRGVSHDWKTNRDKPTIHVMPLTFYEKESFSGKTRDIPDEYLELVEVKEYE